MLPGVPLPPGVPIAPLVWPLGDVKALRTWLDLAAALLAAAELSRSRDRSHRSSTIFFLTFATACAGTSAAVGDRWLR